jgi:hypothetical protein
VLVIKQFTVIDGPKWFLKPARTVFTDRDQTVGVRDMSVFPHAVQPLPHRGGDGGRHAFTRHRGKLTGEPVGFGILDIEAHFPPFHLSTMEEDISRRAQEMRRNFQSFKSPLAR